jgi:hypothetical protein
MWEEKSMSGTMPVWICSERRWRATKSYKAMNLMTGVDAKRHKRGTLDQTPNTARGEYHQKQ